MVFAIADNRDPTNNGNIAIFHILETILQVVTASFYDTVGM